MSKNYNDFCDQVCALLTHAPRRERENVRKELSAHIEGHIQFLMAIGRSREDAESSALAAMGDPEEIGKAWNLEFPIFWRVASGLSLLLMLALLFAFGLILASRLYDSDSFWQFIRSFGGEKIVGGSG